MKQTSLLTDTPENLIRTYRRLVEKDGIPVSKMILFGSYAKGNPKPWSDVDVCVVSPAFGINNYDELVRLMHLRGPDVDMIEPHPMSPEDLEDPWNPLADEIRKYGKLIV